MSESKFLAIDPKLEDYWRAIILFGKNVACYKFALAKSLLELAPQGKTIITLEDLAEPYSRHIIEHLKIVDKQTTSLSSRFLNACRQFNNGDITKTRLIDTTVQRGFENVIDAFHNLSIGETAVRFFIDERRGVNKGIVLTDELFKLLDKLQSENLPHEVEARWRLVETAWELNISRNLISIGYDPHNQLLFTFSDRRRRVDVTSCRDALNGYQKGKCFYSFADISIEPISANLADVDHFFPHSLNEYIGNIDGVWNLVLSSTECNRGERGKFDRLPDTKYLERLHNRNEFLITSNHPLRETLIQQTGKTEEKRQDFLQSMYNTAQTLLGTGRNDGWKSKFEYPVTF
ncbi:HNH endonuclease domain-containing protein (plasmid) [Nostoc sp. UHCC 0926]|uniref:HNH endonuclease domain-containing protein n=1 Tax=Nostoc sp. UHCC 0926 TaxID=3025190 RepID=UPI0023610D50|nr:HNH endonuclease domain-containing protein [Nostoc sp. UHCC 0926]WDD36004.1 HNH endonuclease domain-containing protein [Nostoc sp. UHCC 0926]